MSPGVPSGGVNAGGLKLPGEQGASLEEFAALEERYNFLSTQLEDVKGARKDLMDVIADVDERILRAAEQGLPFKGGDL